jgi:tetratricopeptide (TPR) repeat protein
MSEDKSQTKSETENSNIALEGRVASLETEVSNKELEGRVSSLEVKVSLLLRVGTTVFALLFGSTAGVMIWKLWDIGRELGALSSKVDGYDKEAVIHLLSDVQTDDKSPVAKELKQTFERVAKDVIEKNNQGQPVPAGLYYELGVFSSNNGKLEDAISYFQQATKGNPLDYRAFSSMGACYLWLALKHKGQEDQERYYTEKAVEVLKTAIGINPNHVNAHNNFGIALYLLKQRSEAINEWNTAIRINYTDDAAYYNLASMYAREKERGKALEFLEKAIINYGYSRLGELDNDSDFDDLRQDEKFKKLREIVVSRNQNVVAP